MKIGLVYKVILQFTILGNPSSTTPFTPPSITETTPTDTTTMIGKNIVLLIDLNAYFKNTAILVVIQITINSFTYSQHSLLMMVIVYMETMKAICWIEVTKTV